MDEAALPLEAREPETSRGLVLFHVRGIRVRVDVSWLLIFALVLLGLSAGWFPSIEPDLGAVDHWTAGVITTLLFFASLLLHELAHSLVAVRAGIPVPEITLFLFGGASRMQEEPGDPATEFKVAVVGPLTSLALAGIFWALSLAGGGWPWMIPAMLSVLATVNLAIGIFNLLPGYPLDGGRILRSILWRRTGSLRRATAVASSWGKALALCLMVLGGLELLLGSLVGGVWFLLIGMFLRGMAMHGYQEVLVRQALSEVPVSQVMTPAERLVFVPPDATLRELVDDYVLQHAVHGFPVREVGGPSLGLVVVDDVRRVEKERWSEARVRDVMAPLDAETCIGPDATVLEAMKRLSKGGRRRLLVERDGEVVGLIGTGAISRYLELQSLVGSVES